MADEQALIAFISDKWNDGIPVEPDESLIESGIIDSLGLNELSVFIEKNYGVRIPDTELNEETIGSVRKLMDYVESHSQA